MHVTSWGTRESGKSKDKGQVSEKKYSKIEDFFNHRLKNAISFGNIFSVQCCPEPEDRESYEKIARKCNDYQQKAVEEDKGHKKKNDGAVTKKNTKPLKFGFYKYDFNNLTKIEKDGKRKECERSKIKPDAHEFFSWFYSFASFID